MLNDRIIQTLEALTQVRASVHGIGQQQLPLPQQPFPQYGSAWTQQALGHSPAVPPYAPYAPFTSAMSPFGLSHSSYPLMNAISPWQTLAPSPYAAYAQPYAQYGQPYAQQYGQPWSPFTPMGLSHTGIDEVERRLAEQRANDISRLVQTFPYGAYV